MDKFKYIASRWGIDVNQQRHLISIPNEIKWYFMSVPRVELQKPLLLIIHFEINTAVASHLIFT